MAATRVQPSDDKAVSTKEADRLQSNLRLSMKPENSLPGMLMAAPFAINFLGQLRLMAFSDTALKISLEKPEKGFEYLKYPSLSSAMQQILQQTYQAFDVASKNMSGIERDIMKLFGRVSCAQEIIECLRNKDLAKIRLRACMRQLRDGITGCSDKAKDIEQTFNLLVATVNELNIAMGHQMKNTESQMSEVNNKLFRAAVQRKIQENLYMSFRQEYERFEREAEADRKRFDKNFNKGEWGALRLKAAMDFQSGIAGLISGAVGIIKETPKFATQAVVAAGALAGGASRLATTGTFSSSTPSQDNDQGQTSNTMPTQDTYSLNAPASAQGSSIGIDPAIAFIDRMESSVCQVFEAVQQDLLPILLEDGHNHELISCSEQLKAYKAELGDFKSLYVASAKEMLDRSIRTVDDILKSDKLAGSVQNSRDVRWQKKVEQWHRDMKESHYTAVYLKGVASAQPGQGFGDASLDMAFQAPADPNNSNLDLAGILNYRTRKLRFTRAAMEDSKRRLQEKIEGYRDWQRRLIEAGSLLESLREEKITVEALKGLLRKAIDNLGRLQNEVVRLNQFFDFVSGTVSVLMDTVLNRFLDNIESGISEEENDFNLSYGQVQTNTIRQTILSLRGQVSFTIESTRLYLGISQKFIEPSMRMAANIPLGASVEEQQIFINELKTFTTECATAIMDLATQELEKTKGQLDNRLIELGPAEIDLPALPSYVGKAIDEGIQDASRQKYAETESLQKSDKEMEDTDDILGSIG